jgi:hypothetical protein
MTKGELIKEHLFRAVVRDCPDDVLFRKYRDTHLVRGDQISKADFIERFRTLDLEWVARLDWVKQMFPGWE